MVSDASQKDMHGEWKIQQVKDTVHISDPFKWLWLFHTLIFLSCIPHSHFPSLQVPICSLALSLSPPPPFCTCFVPCSGQFSIALISFQHISPQI